MQEMYLSAVYSIGGSTHVNLAIAVGKLLVKYREVTRFEMWTCASGL